MAAMQEMDTQTLGTAIDVSDVRHVPEESAERGTAICPVCLTVSNLPETLLFGRQPRCPVCAAAIARYLPCVRCEIAFNPQLPACPRCGIRPPDEAFENPVWQIPDRLLHEALDLALRTALPEPLPAAAPEPAAEPAPSKRAASNGNGRGSQAAALAALPEVAAVAANGKAAEHGDIGEAPALPPGVQIVQDAVTAEEAPAALFAAAAEGGTAAVDADFELIVDAARLAEVIASLSEERVVAVDTETTGLDPFVENTLLLVQVATPHRAYLIDARRVDPRPLAPLLADERVLKLLQNAKFDYKMLKQQLGIGLRNIYDTMLAERLLTAGISREIGLASLARKYLNLTLDKSIRSSFVDKTGEFSQDQLRYAARDALVLFSIYAQQREALKRARMLEVALLEFRTVVAVGDMELAGCLIDQERWRRIIAKATAERDRSANELGDLIAGAVAQQSLFGGPAINLNSNAQLIETFGRMGIELPDTMEATLLKVDHPAVKKLLEYRGHEKTLSAFGEKFLELIHPITGRIHPDFNQLGADTGRFSCIAEGSGVMVPGGVTPIEQVYVGQLVYSFDAENTLCLKPVTAMYDQGIKECVKITWKSRYTETTGALICTPDHMVRTLVRGWVRADSLTSKDVLVYLHRGTAGSRGRRSLGWTGGNNRLEQVVLKEMHFGVDASQDIHHRNGNYDDNRLENLEVISRAEHTRLHATKHMSRFAVLRMLARAKGRLTFAPFDFDTLKRKCDYMGIDYRRVQARYSSTGMYLSRARVHRAILLHRRVDYAAQHLGIGTRRLKSLCREYDLTYNHKVMRVERVGVYHVYDLSIADTQCFVAEEMAVHNCTNPNVQQIPATSDFRSCFVAPQGHKLITCDYSQAELRILAQLSEDPAFIEAFCSGGDLHQLTASQMFGVPPDQVAKQQRSAAKVINFGLAYGRGPAALGGQLGISTDEAKRLIDQYFKAYSGIGRWLDRAAKDAVRKGYSVTPLGRKRFYAELDADDPDYGKKRASVERQGKNSPIQGCVPGHVRVFEQSRGYVPIERLCGERVTVWDGRQFASAYVVASGKKQLVRVTLWGNHAIECSPDHRFLVRDPNGRSMWKTPGEFKPQHRVMLTEGVPEWAVPGQLPPGRCDGSWNARAVSVDQIGDQALLGEWLGRVASDGSVQPTTISVLIAEHEEAVLPRLQAASAQLGHVGYRVHVTERQPRRFHMLTISSRGLARQLQALGVKERIPECAWQDSRILSGYLRGLFDGDGAVAPDGALLVFGRGATHLDWARQVQEALLLFGVRGRVRAYPGDRTVVQVLKKDMPIFAARIGFMNPIKQEKAARITGLVRERTYGRGARVKHVEMTNTWVEMYDVVNSETGRFMANGMIVHNSNADMTKLALIGLNQALADYDARVVNTVHDEIVVEAREEQAEEVCHLVEREMIKAGERIVTLVPVVADAKIADYWSK